MDVSGTIDGILNQKSGDIFSISPEATVFEAIELMDNKNVGALLVMEADRLIGMISERDYTRKVMLRGKRSRETKVAEIMSANLTVTHPREPVEKCLHLMTDKRIRHLPVLDGDKVVGNISIKRTISILRCLWTRRWRNKLSSVSSPIMPKGAVSNSTSFSKSAWGA